MQVILESPDTPATETHDRSLRHIQSAMRSLKWLVSSARVRLSQDTARGAIDKRCEVELTTEAGEQVVVASLARDWHSALQSALGRASRSLLHRFQQDKRKQPEKNQARARTHARRAALRLGSAGA